MVIVGEGVWEQLLEVGEEPGSDGYAGSRKLEAVFL